MFNSFNRIFPLVSMACGPPAVSDLPLEYSCHRHRCCMEMGVHAGEMDQEMGMEMGMDRQLGGQRAETAVGLLTQSQIQELSPHH